MRSLDLLTIHEMYKDPYIAKYFPFPGMKGKIQPCLLLLDNKINRGKVDGHNLFNIALLTEDNVSIDEIIQEWNRYNFNLIYELWYQRIFMIIGTMMLLLTILCFLYDGHYIITFLIGCYISWKVFDITYYFSKRKYNELMHSFINSLPVDELDISTKIIYDPSQDFTSSFVKDKGCGER